MPISQRNRRSYFQKIHSLQFDEKNSNDSFFNIDRILVEVEAEQNHSLRYHEHDVHYSAFETERLLNFHILTGEKIASPRIHRNRCTTACQHLTR